MSMQAGMTKRGELAFFTSIHRTLREVFPVVAGYQTFVSCFGTPWGFIVASKKVDPNKQDAKTSTSSSPSVSRARSSTGTA
jgi:spermidine synthase